MAVKTAQYIFEGQTYNLTYNSPPGNGKLRLQLQVSRATISRIMFLAER